MIRKLPFLAALFLLCLIAQAHNSTYSSGLAPMPDNAPILTGSYEKTYNDCMAETMVLADGSCTELHNDGFESSFGQWSDGGSNCARSNSFPNSGSFSVELRSGVGITSSMFTQTMNFVGVGVHLSFSFYPQGYETGEGLVLEYSTDGGTIYSGFTAWLRGYGIENNTRYNVTVAMNNVSWSSQSRLRLRSIASATDDRVYIDDVVISNCCQLGASCNDNNQCTTGDVINANCQCVGVYQDEDSDGTCDAFDICPGEDDYQVISGFPCDDGDPCTLNDHLQVETCACGGQYTDWDQDGYCQAEDPDDVDACNPEPDNPACNPCTTHDYAHFESDFGNWNSGGNDCSRVYAPQYASAGNYCVRIQDNTGMTSSMLTDNFNLAGPDHVSVSFSFIAVSMESGEDFFLDVSTNGGATYTPFASWKSGADFQNNSREFVFTAVTGFTWTSQTRFRFRCDASANDDRVYIDDITIRSCLNYPALQASAPEVAPSLSYDFPVTVSDNEEIVLSPNPAASELRILGMSLEDADVQIFNASGSRMSGLLLNTNSLDVSELFPGLYFVRIEKDDQLIIRRFVKE